MYPYAMTLKLLRGSAACFSQAALFAFDAAPLIREDEP